MAPYLQLGLRVFVGQEVLLPEALAGGAYGSVSGLSSAFPGDVRRVLDDPAVGVERLAVLRDALGVESFIPALKRVLHDRGLPVRPDVRAPLLPVSDEHAARLATL